MTIPVIAITSDFALREYLHSLNERGLDDRCSGVTNAGEPFLAFLVGPYAESTGVIVCDPWDGERDTGTGVMCLDCGAKDYVPIGDLTYPVFVLAPHERDPK